MAASPVENPVFTGLTSRLNGLQSRRCVAALVFAQETMNNREDLAAEAFADYYEASVEYQLEANRTGGRR